MKFKQLSIYILTLSMSALLFSCGCDDCDDEEKEKETKTTTETEVIEEPDSDEQETPVEEFNPGESVTSSWSGTYHGKNLYVENSSGPNREIWGITAYSVNGEEIEETAFSSFEIDLGGHFELEDGDSFELVISHFSNMPPKLLNPEDVDIE